MVASLPARPGVDPQQALFCKTFKEVTAHVEVDEAFGKVKTAIEGHLGLLQKQAQVRVRNWLKKLSEETANVTWKKNRNAYARLLLEQLRCGKLAEPFSTQPPGGPLPTLPKHLAYAFKPARGGSSSPSAASGGSGAFSQAPPAAQQPAAPAALAQQQQQQQQQRLEGLSATEQLDAYLGRARFRRAQYADEELASAAAAGGSRGAGSGANGGVTGGTAELQHLPGTRIHLRGAEAARVDRRQLADVAWQPSKLELEAQLGAARERQAELEWRLATMEGLLHKHEAVLQAQSAAPLGSLLDAIDGAADADAKVSPPRGLGSPAQQARRQRKQELEQLIERHEAKRREWRAPGGTASSAAAQRRPPPAVHSDEEEILDQLDKFQRETETIRRALAGERGGGGAADSYVSNGGGMGCASSLTANTSGGSEWGAPEGTPLRQHATGLRGGGYSPHAQGRRGGGAESLFDGLPPSPAAFAGGGVHANRHVQHAGHYGHGSSGAQRDLQPPAAPQPYQPAAQAPATVQASSGRRAVSAAAAEQQQRPRSPIGPDIRHTRKSLAAAERASSAAALQRLKSTRQPAAGAASSSRPQSAAQQQQQAPTPSSRACEPQRADAGVQAQPSSQRLSAQEWSGRQPTASAATSPMPAPGLPELPPDSNAALVAEVRQLRSKLMASLQLHAPELVAGGPGGALSSSAADGSRPGGGWAPAAGKRLTEDDHRGSPASSCRLAAGPAATAPPPASTTALPPSVGRSMSSSPFRLEDQLQGPAAWGPPSVAKTAGATSSAKYRLTTEEASSHRLADLGSSFGGGGGVGGFGGAATPGSMLSGSGGASLVRFSTLDGGAGLGASLAAGLGGSGSFSLEAFEAQTEALRRQLAGLLA